MKKLVSVVLAVLFLLSSYAFPVRALEPQNVDIPCQTVFGNTVADTVVHGKISNNTLYVSLKTIAELTGAQYAVTEFNKEIMLIFGEEVTGNPHAFEFDLQTFTLKEIHALMQDRTWKIPSLQTDNGDVLVSLDHTLAAINAKMEVVPTAQTPLVIRRPYTVLDAYTMIINNPTSLFNWSDVDANLSEDDIKKYNQLSVINSLLMDYSSHLVTDGLFSWWNDDILNITEAQYQDTMIEILSCFSNIDSSITDSIDYEVLSLHGDVDGIVNNMMDLFGIEDLAKVYNASSTSINHVGILVEAFNNYLTYQQIAESEVNLLKNAFLQNRPQTIFNEPDLKPIKIAAQHLQTLLDGGAESVLTQMAETLSQYGASVASQLTPLAIIEAATTITSLLPGMSEKIDQNNALMKATHCVVLDYLCRNEFVIQKNRLISEGPTEEILSGMKDTLLFSLQASFCARKLMVENNICTPEVAKRLQEDNVKTLEIILFLQNCSTEMVGDTVDYQYNSWDTYQETLKADDTNHPVEVYSQALAKLDGANLSIIKEGSFLADFANFSELQFTQNMDIQGFGDPTMTASGHYTSTGGSSDGTNEMDYDFTYDSQGIHIPNYEQPVTGELVTFELPPLECVHSYSETESNEKGKTYLVIYDGDSLTQENCGIFSSVLTSPFHIYWSPSEEYADEDGIQEAEVLFSTDNDGNLVSIEVSYQMYAGIQGIAAVEGTTTFTFGSVIANGENVEQHIPEGAGEYAGHRYYVFNMDSIDTWEDADAYCKSLGGHLATITSAEEDAFVYRYLTENYEYESAYFGFSDHEQEGVWKWVTGEPVSYTNWGGTREPNGENQNEDYAMYYYKYDDGGWNDGDFGGRTVNSGRVFICEWDVTPTEAVSDNAIARWDEFIVSGEYQEFTSQMIDYEGNQLESSYSLVDIDGDGWEEMILYAPMNDGIGFGRHAVLSCNETTGNVSFVPIETRTEEGTSEYSNVAQNFRGVSYSAQSHALCYRTMNNGAMFDSTGFWVLKDEQMNCDFSVGFDQPQEYWDSWPDSASTPMDPIYYISDDYGRTEISKEEYDAYTTECDPIEFQAFP